MFITVQQNFRIGFGFKCVTFCNQLFTYTLKVINFSVEKKYFRAVFIKNRLIPLSQVDNTKTSESESDSLVNISAAGIRTTVNDLVHHIAENYI